MITIKRIFNQLKCWLSYGLSRFNVLWVKHYPTFFAVEPANYCQLRCPQCPVGQAQHPQPQTISQELYSKTLDEIGELAHTVILYFQGEPLLNKQLPQMVKMAKERGLYTIVSTNGQALTEEMASDIIRAGIDKIIVSMDGFTQESYAVYRVGGSLQKAKDGLRFLHEAKVEQGKRAQIVLQCLRLKSNETEWENAKKQYKAWGADRLVFKTAQFYDYEQGNALMPTNEKYSRYRKVGDRYERKKKIRNSCLRLWSGCVVTVNGNVLPCCFDKSQQHILGNIANASIQAIWQSQASQQFRKQVLHCRKDIKICQNCTE